MQTTPKKHVVFSYFDRYSFIWLRDVAGFKGKREVRGRATSKALSHQKSTVCPLACGSCAGNGEETSQQKTKTNEAGVFGRASGLPFGMIPLGPRLGPSHLQSRARYMISSKQSMHSRNSRICHSNSVGRTRLGTKRDVLWISGWKCGPAVRCQGPPRVYDSCRS